MNKQEDEHDDEAISTQIEELIYLGLTTDGAHHKQWCLYQIGKLLKMDLTYVDGDPLDEGIAP